MAARGQASLPCDQITMDEGEWTWVGPPRNKLRKRGNYAQRSREKLVP